MACRKSHTTIFLFILHFLFLQEVSGCLVIRKNPDLGNCNCNVKLFTQEDIRNNAGGKYLGDHRAWSPIVEAQDNCSVTVTCKPVPGVSSFFTVLFRGYGPPIYINRVVANETTFVERPLLSSDPPFVERPQPRSIDTFECKWYSGGYEWFYYDELIRPVAFACVADTNSCDCPQIAYKASDVLIETRRPAALDQCGFFRASCPNNDEVPYLHSPETLPIQSGNGRYPWGSAWRRFEDLLCVKNGTTFDWYFGNLKLKGQITVECDTNRAIFQADAAAPCGVFKDIEHIDDLYQNKIGYFADAEFGKNSWTPSSEFEMKCDDGFRPVVFSPNNDPIESPSLIRCTYNQLLYYSSSWIVNGIRIINPSGACMKHPMWG